MGIIGGGLDFKLSVENEWLCAQFPDAIGLNVARTSRRPIVVISS
jgi:hypothetical protein